jgi:hypothetical protein
MAEQPSPDQEVRRLYEEAESRMAKAAERLVSRDSFGELLAMMTENVVALTKIGNETMDLALRNMRVAGRSDVARLARQLGRTEDKLEQVLQEVEQLRDELAAERSSNGSPAGRTERRGDASPPGDSDSGNRRRTPRAST